MSNEEFEFILAALEFVAIYGQRFLPLYHFDLGTGSWTFKKAMKDLIMTDTNCKAEAAALASGVNAVVNINHEKSQGFNIQDDKRTALVSKFALYMDSAMQIARLLPKFPSQRRLQVDEDLSILHFRV